MISLRKYLDYLQAAFLIHRLYRVDQNARRFKRVTHFKVYLTNPSIRSALFGPVDADSEAMGRMAETAVISQIAQSAQSSRCYYARWKTGEVDLVFVDSSSQQAIEAREIKWSDRVAEHPERELRGFIDFCTTNNVPKPTVTTRTVHTDISINKLDLSFVPTSVSCLAFAKATIEEPLGRGLDPRTYLPFLDALTTTRTP